MFHNENRHGTFHAKTSHVRTKTKRGNMKHFKNVSMLLISMSFIANVAHGQTNAQSEGAVESAAQEGQPDRGTLKALRSRALVQELKVLTIKKNLMESYATDSGRVFILASMESIISSSLGAALGAYAGGTIALFDGEILKGKQAAGKALTANQLQRLEIYTKHIRTAMDRGSVKYGILGAGVGLVGYALVHQVEAQQLGKLVTMTDAEIEKEYHKVIARLVSLSIELESIANEERK